MAHLLFHAIERTAADTPEQDAFRFLDRSVSYAALSAASGALANACRVYVTPSIVYRTVATASRRSRSRR